LPSLYNKQLIITEWLTTPAFYIMPFWRNEYKNYDHLCKYSDDFFDLRTSVHFSGSATAYNSVWCWFQFRYVAKPLLQFSGNPIALKMKYINQNRFLKWLCHPIEWCKTFVEKQSQTHLDRQRFFT
jgi:hypothetical protein